MKKNILTLLLVAFVHTSFATDTSPRATVPLDHWQFALDEATNAPAAPSFDDAAWTPVTLPHTWNNFDGQDGGNNYHRGTGWYRTMIFPPDAPNDRRVLVEFDAASRVTEVFVNGKSVGEHTGSFGRFRFDITDQLNRTPYNLLAVRVNNSTNDLIPRGGDFTIFGGLYRPARLLVTAPAHIATLDYASPGVYITTENVSTNSALVKVRVKLVNDSTKVFSGRAVVEIGHDGSTEFTMQSATVTLPAKGSMEHTFSVSVTKPHLWNGVDDPHCYQATVRLTKGKETVDALEQTFGIRDFELKPDAGFFLNGQHLGLHGVNRHQDRLDKGWAISDDDKREDFKIMQELGVNTVRLAHYQHDQFFYDLCDHGGLAVWAELCFVTEPPHTPEGRHNAKQQLRELIRQNFNHPSIFFWSIGNETSNTNLAFDVLTELNAVAHEEDSTRPTTYATNHKVGDPRNNIPDILGINRYFGWYYGEYPGFGKFMDELHALQPHTPLGVSEYGAGASIYQHEENPPIRHDQAQKRGSWHPEEWQNTFHEETWLQMQQRPWLWGTYIWNMFDFVADARGEGDIYGRNDKGLVTYDRQTRKDAYYFYQANWTTKPMVHITSKRFSLRSQPGTTLKIYSNGDEVETKLNGKSLGKKTSPDHRFVWPDVELKPGPNRLEAVAYRGGQPVASDAGNWTYRADGDPLPNVYIAQKEAEARQRDEEKRAKDASTNAPAAK